MTPEQLDEIEKEAKDGGPEDDGAGDIAAFLVDCRILPLVKALREARAEAEQLRGALRPTGHNPKTCCCPDCCTLRQVTEERDKAHAEVERLKDERGEAMASLAALKQEYRPADELRTQLLVEMEAHAETRSEVERLRDIIKVLKSMDTGKGVLWVES